jgi:hypothetical protein
MKARRSASGGLKGTSPHATQLAERLRKLLAVRRKTKALIIKQSDDSQDSELFELVEAAEVDCSWAELYEFPLRVPVFLSYLALGLADYVFRPLTGTEVLVDRLFRLDAESEEPDFLRHLEDSNVYTLMRLLQLQISVEYSLQCMQTYSVSLNDLLQRVKDGNDLAFRRAVGIDPTIIQAPTMQRRLAFAVIEKDKKFLSLYRAAIANGPHKARATYSELRLVELMMRELGAFKNLSQEEIHDVVVSDLRLYGRKDSDNLKGLFALIANWRKDATK